MMRSLYSGVAGLKTHQTKMDVIGNNIANVNTVGFKASNVNFSDLLYQTTKTASAANDATGTTGTNANTLHDKLDRHNLSRAPLHSHACRASDRVCAHHGVHQCPR